MHWRHAYTWAIFAAVLALVGYLFTPWPGLGLVPIAWFFWVMGRRIGGDRFSLAHPTYGAPQKA